MKVVYDIETYKEIFLYCDQDIQSGERHIFEISFRKNDLYSMVKYLTSGDIEWQISFNGVAFDSQVLQFIIDEHEKWFDKTNQEIIDIIYDFAQLTIENSNYELLPKYKEEHLDNQQIDLFLIHHYNNKNRRVGLKWLEFSLDIPNIQELPIGHAARGLTSEDLDTVIVYCWNDIEATIKFYEFTIGKCENELYKGKDKIQDRLDLIEEMNFSSKALNYSDVKIGDEINRTGYKSIAKIDDKKLYQLKKYRKSTAGFTFGDCIPSYVTFKTPLFQKFFNEVSKQKVNLNVKQEFELHCDKTKYSIMKGGIHSKDTNRILIAQDGYILRDADVGSQYPNAIVKRALYPSHLGADWLVNYKNTIEKRLDYKGKGKDNPKFKGLADTFKLALNGGGFGKTNERDSWQYDPRVMYNCTIGNQFEMLMLIEELQMADIQVLSANTDGIVSYFKKELEDKYNEICNNWELIVGNDKLGKLEFSDFKSLIQTSVNDYIAIKLDGEVKTKGDFSIDVELHKNKSRRIVPIALNKFFVEGISVEDTILNHKNIFDFCVGVKSSKDYFYQGVDRDSGHSTKYNQMLRYYISTEGEKLYKIKKEGSDKKGPAKRELEAGVDHQIVFNRAYFPSDFSEYKIDYSYYISKAKAIIHKLRPDVKAQDRAKETGQLTLF